MVYKQANRIFINAQQKSKNYGLILCLNVILAVIFLQNIKQHNGSMKNFGPEPTHTSIPRVSMYQIPDKTRIPKY